MIKFQARQQEIPNNNKTIIMGKQQLLRFKEKQPETNYPIIL